LKKLKKRKKKRQNESTKKVAKFVGQCKRMPEIQNGFGLFQIDTVFITISLNLETVKMPKNISTPAELGRTTSPSHFIPHM